MGFDARKQKAGGYRVAYAMRSRAGDRQRNEDNIRMGEKEGEYFFALADGLGGHGKGDEASRIVTEQAYRTFQQSAPHKACLEEAFDNAQRRLLAEKTQRGLFSAMKTTMVLLRLDEEYAEWAHMGDSRLYAFRNGRIQMRTRDHSVPQMLVLNGEIQESEIRHHPDRSCLLRAMGGESENCRCDVSERFPLEGNCGFLLCTDGFWELIEEYEMEETLSRAVSPAQWLDSMEQIVLQNGTDVNMDNYSAIAVWVLEE